METRVELYKNQLLAAGFKEATRSPNNYYREDTELTAFFVNLKILRDSICVFYGFASTAFTRMVGCENSLIQSGIWEKDTCLRFYGEIRTESDAKKLLKEAKNCFCQFSGTEKDSLLKLIKDRRKAFLDQISMKLKPLGFRKKGNQWRVQLAENIILQFWADKNPYADLYFFEVDIYSEVSKRGLWCFSHRMSGLSIDKFSWNDREVESDDFDWQLQSSNELSMIIERALNQYLLPIRNTSLSELGSQRFIWERCICPRDCCETCWIQKNLWEAKEN